MTWAGFLTQAIGEVGLTLDEIEDMGWDEYHLRRLYHFKQRQGLYIQREILARLMNGVPAVMVERTKSKKGFDLFPLIGEADEIRAEHEKIKKQMDQDPAFQPDMIKLKDGGYMTRTQWQQSQS